MTIPPRFKDEIRSRLTLSSIIGKKVRLTRAGREFKACCPFHNEKSPSFYVNDDKQFYHCFGCGAHGDVIGFVMQHDNLSFIDAIEALAAEAGLEVPRMDPGEVQKAEKARDLYALLDAAARWMEEQLHAPKNREVLEYLTGRGLNAETLAAFRIGFAPGDRQIMRAFLKSKGFDDGMMAEAGLVKKNDKGEIYAFFRDRVMFPVTDRRGRVIAFSGRILPDHLRPPERGDYKPGKYINSPEGPLFDKGRTLYAEAQARQAARDGKPIILTEGQMDVIACNQAGFKGAVAPMGTALTEEQVLRMWSMIVTDEKVPILCFDGDNAGRKAASRACERILPLLKPDQSVRFSFLPEGEDPDSLIKASGAGALQKILDSAISLFDFLWLGATSGRDFSVPEVRAGVVKNLNEEISRIADREVQKHYQALAQELVSASFFQRRNDGPAGRKGGFRPAAVRPGAPVFGGIHGRILLAALINHPHIFPEAEEPMGRLDLHGPGLNALRDAVITALSGDPGLDREALKHHLEEIGLQKERDDILSESLYVHAGFAAPGADSSGVSGQWLDFWQDMQKKAAQKEISAGWRTAFQSESPEEEERLKTIIQAGGQGGA